MLEYGLRWKLQEGRSPWGRGLENTALNANCTKSKKHSTFFPPNDIAMLIIIIIINAVIKQKNIAYFHASIQDCAYEKAELTQSPCKAVGCSDDPFWRQHRASTRVLAVLLQAHLPWPVLNECIVPSYNPALLYQWPTVYKQEHNHTLRWNLLKQVWNVSFPSLSMTPMPVEIRLVLSDFWTGQHLKARCATHMEIVLI